MNEMKKKQTKLTVELGNFISEVVLANDLDGADILEIVGKNFVALIAASCPDKENRKKLFDLCMNALTRSFEAWEMRNEEQS